jgi:hypothetical protein
MDAHTALLQRWSQRSPERLPDEVWHATMNRVRGEFVEMPCLRLTHEQARLLLGLNASATVWVLGCLAREGFLMQTPNGEFVRRSTAP